MTGKSSLTHLHPGQRGTTSGFPATVIRHYSDGMYEVRVPGGVTCIPASDFIPETPSPEVLAAKDELLEALGQAAAGDPAGEFVRGYGREDVTYETWYSPWMKQLAQNYTRAELHRMLATAMGEGARAARSHLRTIQRTHSMTSNSMARAHAGNVTAAAGEKQIAMRGALEIHDLFPEHARAA
jgi:hypothetical protein